MHRPVEPIITFHVFLCLPNKWHLAKRSPIVIRIHKNLLLNCLTRESLYYQSFTYLVYNPILYSFCLFHYMLTDKLTGYSSSQIFSWSMRCSNILTFRKLQWIRTSVSGRAPSTAVQLLLLSAASAPWLLWSLPSHLALTLKDNMACLRQASNSPSILFLP